MGAVGCKAASPTTMKDSVATVYYIKDITPENLVKIYEALGKPATGKVAVKISTEEPGGHNFLNPKLIAPLVKKVDGRIVECNTADKGKRYTSSDSYQAAVDHGFTAIEPMEIMDSIATVKLPLKGGKHLKYDIVGADYPNYDFTIILSHFKGHAIGGFGGAIKKSR